MNSRVSRLFILIYLSIALTLVIQVAFSEDYDKYSIDQLNSLGVTSAQWLETYNSYTQNEKNKQYAITSQSIRESGDYIIHSYSIVPGLQIDLYCNHDDIVMKAFVDACWENLSESEQYTAGSLMGLCYLYTIVSTDFEAKYATDISAAIDEILPSKIQFGNYKQYSNRGYIYYGRFAKPFHLEEGFFKEIGQPTKVTGMVFRGIPWLESLGRVKATIEKENGIQPSWYRPVYENARIDGWYREGQYVYSDDNVENGGVMLRYSNLKVAGYEADCELSFIYPISNGKIDYTTNNALFYKAIYEITGLEDIDNAYDDIADKLSQLYGQFTEKSYYNNVSRAKDPYGQLWEDENGAKVWLCKFYNLNQKKYDEIWLTYSAPNTEDMIQKLIVQSKQEQANEEAQKRNANKNNMEGL